MLNAAWEGEAPAEPKPTQTVRPLLMNHILEQLYPDKAVLAKRQETGLPPLEPCTDSFIAYLHEELRQCYLNGHDHASLVTACVLVEYAVKDAVQFDDFVKADCVFHPDKWDKIDAHEFGKVIGVAKRRGIISKEEWRQLDWIRTQVRNVYLHGQTPHWIKDKHDTVLEGNLSTGEVKALDVNLRDNIVLQRVIRIAADRNICDHVVRLVDDFVRRLGSNSLKTLDEWKKANGGDSPQLDEVETVLRKFRDRGFECVVVADKIERD